MSPIIIICSRCPNTVAPVLVRLGSHRCHDCRPRQRYRSAMIIQEPRGKETR